MYWRTWSPFRSGKIRQIYEHMTPEEKREATERGVRRGRMAGLTFAGPAMVVFSLGIWPKLARKLGLASCHSPVEIPLWLGISIIAILVAICVPWARRGRKKQRQFLASTEWARSQGYTADDL